LVPKKLSLLHELVPNAAVIALLVDLNVADAAQVNEVQGQGAENDARPRAPSPRARTTAPGRSVWRQNTLGSALPVARRDRKTALPDARWRTRIWRTQGPAQRQLQAWPVHRRGDRLSQVAEAANTRREGAD
jgi:hypothetical protein